MAEDERAGAAGADRTARPPPACRRRPPPGGGSSPCSRAHQQESRGRRGRARERSWRSSASSRTSATAPGTSGPKPAPGAKARLGAPPRRTPSTCSPRGCATSGWSPAGVPMYSGTATMPASSPARPSLRPTTTRVSGGRRPGAQRPAHQRRPQARAAGHVRALRGGRRECLGSPASSFAAAAGSTSSLGP